MIAAPVFCRRFVGRPEELGFIVERFREARQSRGAFVLIGGDAGIGKSRLLAEARSRVVQEGARYGSGQCIEHALAPLAPIVELLRETGLVDSDLLRATPALRVGLGRLLPETGARLDGHVAPPVTNDVRGQFAAILEALRRMALASPVVATIEDAHWADLATLDCLQFLAERIAHAPLLLLVTYRCDELHRQHPLALALGKIRRAPNVWRLELAPLSDVEMQAVQHDALAGCSTVLPAHMLREMRALAEGNPLFAEELLRHAVEHGGGAHELPLSVRATVLERLVHLDDEQRGVLVHAAVFGRRFEPAILAEVLDRPLDAIGAALRRARDLQLIVEERKDTVRYAFRHALVREALYSELLTAELRPLHRQIALHLEANEAADGWLADLAYHWWAAREPNRALEYTERAGDAAMNLLAHKDAALHFERALECAAPGKRRADLYAKLGNALGLAGFPRRARAAIERAFAYYDGIGEPARASGLCRQIAWHNWLVTDTDEALTWFERSRQCARATPGAPSAYAALVHLAKFHALRGDAATSSRYLDEAETFAGQPEPSEVAVFFDARALVHSLTGQISRSIADSQSAIDASQRAGAGRRAIECQINLARAAACAGVLDVARHACDAAIRSAREGFATQHEFMALSNRAFVELLAGEYTLARATIQDALDLACDLDPALVRTRIGEDAIPLGLRLQDDDLVRYFAHEDTLELAFRSRETIRIAPMSAAFAELSFTTGDGAKGRALLHRALGAISSPEASSSLMLLVAAHGDPHDVSTARALLARWAEPEDNRAGRAYLALFEASAAGKGGYDQRPHAQRAADLLRALRLPYYEALALELDRQPEAALAIYRRIGDRRDACRLEQHVVNRRGRTKEQLTQRERDIAQLVAEGKANAEIAAHFVLSHRTVENHVSAILHKLGLRSRTELALHVQHKLTATAPHASSTR